MTRKHFETIAISLGLSIRDYDVESNEWEAVVATAHHIAHDLRSLNPRFDKNRFLDFVLDVATGARDLDGKKVHQ